MNLIGFGALNGRSGGGCFGQATFSFQKRISKMTMTVKIGAALMLLLALSSCGNTIRGFGRDTANAVNATQDAGRSVNRAATR
ncbi:entericidin EcnA/B family protein [Rhizobium sullae]|jgi:predicted small secreted protein|uniref:Entericidin EcnA/B family protein n=2 Tax=Rhizobium sullae TaxID=50338 RepID=A0A4R3PX00_RHISU|nr:entericidin EcnA/B family protein [Rhizobium sullae]